MLIEERRDARRRHVQATGNSADGGHRRWRDLSAVFFGKFSFYDSTLSTLNIHIRNAQSSDLGSVDDLLADTASACLGWAKTEKSLGLTIFLTSGG